MTLRERMGILILFLVGGNDTTRNSMTGGLWGLSQFPDQFRKLRENPDLVTGAVSEIVRWQTPVIHMRRTAMADAEIGGKQIKAGEKVVIWYISGNRDEEAIERPNEFIVDRKRPREHMSFGFGIHRCLGNRLAEMQLQASCGKRSCGATCRSRCWTSRSTPTRTSCTRSGTCRSASLPDRHPGFRYLDEGQGSALDPPRGLPLGTNFHERISKAPPLMGSGAKPQA